MYKKLKINKKAAWWLLAIIALGAIFAGYWIFSPKKGAGPQVKIYFVQGDQLIAVSRPLVAGEDALNKAISELLRGPRKNERERGLTTLIPAGVKLLKTKIEGEAAIIDLSRQLENYGGGSRRAIGVVGQIIYTATEIRGIKKAWIWEAGSREIILGGEGLVLDRPLSRQELGN